MGRIQPYSGIRPELGEPGYRYIKSLMDYTPRITLSISHALVDAWVIDKKHDAGSPEQKEALGAAMKDVLEAHGMLEQGAATVAGIAAIRAGPATLPQGTLLGAQAGALLTTATSPAGLPIISVDGAGFTTVGPPAAHHQMQVLGSL